MQPKKIPEKIVGRNIVLRRFNHVDAPAVYDYAKLESVSRWTITMPHPYPKMGALKFIMDANIKFNKGRQYNYAIVLKGKKDEPIGGCSIHDIDVVNRNAYFGYVLGKKHWGKGYATEAAGLMLELGFKILKFHKMSANVFPENPASERILRKYGMILEGVQREKYFRRGEWRDLLNYGILEKEYRKIKYEVQGTKYKVY